MPRGRVPAARVDVAKSAPELWQQAELKFAEAGRKLEEGNVNDTRKRGAEAESLFREAELAAITAQYDVLEDWAEVQRAVARSLAR